MDKLICIDEVIASNKIPKCSLSLLESNKGHLKGFSLVNTSQNGVKTHKSLVKVWKKWPSYLGAFVPANRVKGIIYG